MLKDHHHGGGFTWPKEAKVAVTLTFEQFRYGWANGVGEDEARRLHDRFHVAAPGKPIFQAAVENLNPATELRVDTRAPGRGRGCGCRRGAPCPG